MTDTCSCGKHAVDTALLQGEAISIDFLELLWGAPLSWRLRVMSLFTECKWYNRAKIYNSTCKRRYEVTSTLSQSTALLPSWCNSNVCATKSSTVHFQHKIEHEICFFVCECHPIFSVANLSIHSQQLASPHPLISYTHYTLSVASLIHTQPMVSSQHSLWLLCFLT